MEKKHSHISDKNLKKRKQSPTDDPPFIAQCQDFLQGGPEACQIFRTCKKNPGHPTFIPVKEFNINYLPLEYQSESRMQRIRDCCERTVRVVVSFTSLSRPDTYPNSTAPYPYCRKRGHTHNKRTGTGFVSLSTEWITPRHLSGVICPCHLCRDSDDPKTEYHQLIVSTAAHVVFDHSEAEKTVFELFYDSEDKERIMYLYGVRLFADRGHRQRCEEDRVEVLCVTHKEVDQLFPPFGKRVEVPVSDKSFGVLISHPHGKSKHITVGKFLKREAPVPSICLDSSKKERHITWFTRNFVRNDETSSEENSEYINFNYRPEYVYGCRLPLDAEEPPEELCNLEQRHKTDNHKVYRLKHGVAFSIPFDAPYLCQDVKFGEGWYKFPPGTKMKSERSSEIFVLPDMEFSMDPGQTRKVYSIDTCPGCSGAPVIWALTPDTAPVITHSGALNDGTNRSVLHYV